MSVRKQYCIGDCDFQQHFSQSGKGIGEVFRGAPYQRGSGFSSAFKRYGIPLFKFFGKHMLRTGLDLGSDALDDNLNKETLKKRLRQGAIRLGEDSLGKASEFLAKQKGAGEKEKEL